MVILNPLTHQGQIDGAVMMGSSALFCVQPQRGASPLEQGGSIFPAMLWHALNNALGVLASKHQIPMDELQVSCYVAGAVGLAAAFWIIARNRTPYPGLRPNTMESPLDN